MSFVHAKVRQNFHIIRQIHEKYHDLADYENEITINQCRREHHHSVQAQLRDLSYAMHIQIDRRSE